MDNLVADEILERFDHYRTCSIRNLQEECVTYVKTCEMAALLASAPDTLVVLAPRGMRFRAEEVPRLRHIEIYEADEPAVAFALVHNSLNRLRDPAFNEISQDAWIDPAASIGPEGLRRVKDRSGRVIPFKHMGNVRIHSRAEVGPGSVVHRATLDRTEIHARAVVGSLCNIGHNAVIGEDVILTAGVMVGGSARIGRRCFIGMGAVISNGVRICDDVRVGMGSVVTKSIDRPGVWYGNPVRYIREWNGNWES